MKKSYRPSCSVWTCRQPCGSGLCCKSPAYRMRQGSFSVCGALQFSHSHPCHLLTESKCYTGQIHVQNWVYLSLSIYMGIKAVDLYGYAGCGYIWVWRLWIYMVMQVVDIQWTLRYPDNCSWEQIFLTLFCLIYPDSLFLPQNAFLRYILVRLSGQ